MNTYDTFITELEATSLEDLYETEVVMDFELYTFLESLKGEGNKFEPDEQIEDDYPEEWR